VSEEARTAIRSGKPMLALSIMKGWVVQELEERAKEREEGVDEILGSLDELCSNLLNAVRISPALTEDMGIFVPKVNEDEFDALIARVESCLARL
jgi:hypothetical protein